MAKCLYCYKELNEGEKDFHKACSKKMFDTPSVPELPYTRENLNFLKASLMESTASSTKSPKSLLLEFLEDDLFEDEVDLDELVLALVVCFGVEDCAAGWLAGLATFEVAAAAALILFWMASLTKRSTS